MKVTITLALVLVLVAVANALTATQIQQVVTAHNNERALVGLGPVSYNTSIEQIAQTFVNTCPDGHSGAANLGENMYWSTVQDLTAAVNSWTSEKQYWDCAANTCCKGSSCTWSHCGHYTQVVWASSSQIGCGTKLCGNWHTVVCNYYRPGNYNCQPFCDRPFPQANCPAAPVAAPRATPVATPRAAPVAAPRAAPVAAPRAAPVAAPRAAPVAAPRAAPVAAPRAAPVAAPRSAPVAIPLSAPVTTPTSAGTTPRADSPVDSTVPQTIGTPAVTTTPSNTPQAVSSILSAANNVAVNFVSMAIFLLALL